ncbi:hypothetical protein NC652_032440 [Populus alba x Populus x berolinensis]|nr:hypothetical protein NC652_032440 [Populus alba x Populus x berolinensis]
MPFHFRSKQVFVKLCLFILDPSNLSRMWTTVIWECLFHYLPTLSFKCWYFCLAPSCVFSGE